MSLVFHPLWLLALAVLPVMGVVAWVGARRARQRLDGFTGAELAPRLAETTPAWLGNARTVLVFIFVAFAILSLARPRWGRELRELTTRGADVLVLVDVSRSMDVTDVTPSRMALARAFVSALSSRPASDRIGLVAFAGSAHLLCPLTVDRGALGLFLETLSTGLVPEPGTDLGRAIQKGVDLLSGAPGDPMMVIVSDGEDLGGEALRAARVAADAGIRVHAVGVGTPAGEPVPLMASDGSIEGYQKDEQGQVVTSRLDEQGLRAIASSTGGLYVPLAAGGAAVRALAEEISTHGDSEREVGALSRRPERFQIPLALAVLALGVEVLLGLGVGARAGRPLRATVLLVLLFTATGAGPVDWVDPTVARNRAGNVHYRAGRFAEALESYSAGNALEPGRPELLYNLGNALERQQQHEQAALAYREALDAGAEGELARDLWYNLGNTLLEAGEREPAIDAYRRVLGLEPSHVNARRNLEIALTREQPPPPPQASDSEDPDQDQDPQDSPQPDEPPPPDAESEPQPDEQGDPDRDSPPDEEQESRDQETPRSEEDLTPEQVEQLLRAFEEMEKQQLEEQAAERRAVGSAGGRDW